MTPARSPASIARLRLAAQRLSAAPFDSVVAAARWMLALQAQDFPGACWSLGLRVAGATEATVRAALADGSVVRSWPMRGTLHFTPAEDLGWMLSLTAGRIVRGAAGRRAALGIDDRQIEQAREASQRALSGGRGLTRERMMALFASAGIPTDGQRGYHLLWHLAQQGTLCFGPPEGAEQTFVLLDEWVKQPRRLDREEALAELVVRYFRGHGPATLHDCSWWSSLPMKDVRLGVAAAGERLASLDIEGTRYLLSGELLDAPEIAPPALALPGFDELLLGYQERGAVLPAAFSRRIVPGNNGVFLPTIVIDGQVVGTWKRTQRARHLLIDACLFSPLSAAAREAFSQAAGRHAAFVGKEAKVTFRDA